MAALRVRTILNRPSARRSVKSRTAGRFDSAPQGEERTAWWPAGSHACSNALTERRVQSDDWQQSSFGRDLRLPTVPRSNVERMAHAETARKPGVRQCTTFTPPYNLRSSRMRALTGIGLTFVGWVASCSGADDGRSEAVAGAGLGGSGATHGGGGSGNASAGDSGAGQLGGETGLTGGDSWRGTSATRTVTVEGGDVTLGETRVSVPPGALDEATPITVSEVD